MCLKNNILGLGLSPTMYSALQPCQKNHSYMYLVIYTEIFQLGL